MQLVALHIQATEDDPHLVCKLLTPEEDDDTRLESPFAQRQKQRRPLRFLPCADANELLNKATCSTTLRVDEQPNRLVQRHAHQLVDRISHGSRKEHCLPGSRTRLDDLRELIRETVLEHPVSFVQHKDV